MNVALFITCLTDNFFPQVGAAAVRVLRHYGCTVSFPEAQTCCGQPAFNSGFRPEAATLARRMIDIFAPHEHIVTPSASCLAMVHHYPELFADDPATRAAAVRLVERTHDFGTFLRDRLRVDIAAQLQHSEPFTYHFPCHARDMQTPAELEAMLGDGGALRRPARPELCCGFGGMFAVEYPEVSAGMLTDKLAVFEQTGARVVICNEGGCALHMAGGAHRRNQPLRFRHLAECLAESLGLMGHRP